MKILIFDFDGVLADTTNYCKSLFRKTGFEFSEEDFKAHHDQNVFENPKVPFTRESAKKFFELYVKNITEVTPFFTKKEIESLSNNYKLFIITSNEEKGVMNFLNHNDSNYFDEILGVNFSKSKIEKFKYLLKKYKLSNDDCIFVTDTLGDILEAKKVGIKTIAVDYGFHDRERLTKGNPYSIVSSFDELIKLITK